MLARRRSTFLKALAVVLGLCAASCRTTTDDVERWSTTAQGPRKLVAVLTHNKYPVELRVEAAMALVRMKPRGGKRVGILGQDDLPGLVAALESLAPQEREKIVSRMVPRLEEEIQKPPAPKATGSSAGSVDPTFLYKDAAFALLTHAEGALVQSDENRKRLRTVLAAWCMTDFATRMDESSQLYGVEQVLRELGAEGVARMPDQIIPGAKKIDRMADLVADLGDPKAKAEAARRLAIVAKDIASDSWVQQKAPLVEAANKASKLNPSKEQFQAQLEQYQEEELLRVFASMKKIGGTPSVDFLLDFAKTDKHEKRQAAALAALEGNLDPKNAKHVQAALDLASSPSVPDMVRNVALGIL